MSAVQLQRQLGIRRYETAWNLLHKLRAAMVRPQRDRIGGGREDWRVEVDEGYIGGKTRGKGRGVTDKELVVVAVEVREREGTPRTKDGSPSRRDVIGGRLRLGHIPDRGAAPQTVNCHPAKVPFVGGRTASSCRTDPPAFSRPGSLCGHPRFLTIPPLELVGADEPVGREGNPEYSLGGQPSGSGSSR